MPKIMVSAISILVWLSFGLWVSACQHSLRIVSDPAEAEVIIVDPKQKSQKVIGKTPLETTTAELKSGEIEIRKGGFENTRIFLPKSLSSDLSLEVSLRPLDEQWVSNLPKELAVEIQNQALYDLLSFQNDLYSMPESEAQKRIVALKEQYGHLSAYHYLVGTYYFYKNQFQAAEQAFAVALDRDSKNEQAKQMYFLTKLRGAESTKEDRLRAFAFLQQAAKRVALLANGAVVGVKSHPNLPEDDGFKMIIPTDPIFVPGKAKFHKDGRKILEEVARQLKGLTTNFIMNIGVHSDSDPLAEFRLKQPIMARSMKLSKTLWELTGERAAAVMLFLRSLGVSSAGWSIAGYADSQPLGENFALSDKASLNRRIEIQVMLNQGGAPNTFSEREMEGLRKSLEIFLSDDEDESPTMGSGSPVQPASMESRRRPTNGLPSKPKTGQSDGSSGESAEEARKKREVLERRLRRPTTPTAPKPARVTNPSTVPRPRLPSLKPSSAGSSQ